MPTFIEAVNVNGEKQMIPGTWLEEGHPFADQFKLAPSDRQRADRTPDPSEDWTVPQLRDHADAQGIALTGVTTKADILSAISAGGTSDAVD